MAWFYAQREGGVEAIRGIGRDVKLVCLPFRLDTSWSLRMGQTTARSGGRTECQAVAPAYRRLSDAVKEGVMHRITFAFIGCLLALPTPGVADAPQPPRAYLQFNGMNNFVEVPDSRDFSVSTTGGLAVSAWMRPDTLTFASTEGSGYVHWMGKGEGAQQEWTFRMYSQANSENRENRISFYVFNLAGGLGVGSYFQDPITAGQWIHVVGVADGQSTHIYKNGVLRKSDVYQGSITTQHGTAPLRMGTRDFRSYFQGGLAEVRVWNRVLTATEVGDLYALSIVPPQGLVAEYLFNRGTGNVARDTKDSHDGIISGATWQCAATPANLCLGNGRFAVQVSWRVPSQGTNGVGNAVGLTSDTGYFWFFTSNNIELMIKVVDGRVFNNKFWVFYGALSNVEYTITVTDMASGAVKTYNNSSGTLASVADTSAF